MTRMIPIFPCRSIDEQAEVAVALDDPAGARSLLAEVTDTPLTDEDRAVAADDLATAEDLAHTL